MVIPKPLCKCRVCHEARIKGAPYERKGPSVFIHDENLLIDTPAEIAAQLNNASIDHIDYLMFTHPDPDHIEGFRVVEQITLDFRSWRAYPEKQISLLVPHYLYNRLTAVCSAYGPLMDFYLDQGFIRLITFKRSIKIGKILITAVPVENDDQVSSLYVFDAENRRVVYAPCDIKPFPEERGEVQKADLLAIQPGIFEDGLKHGFIYPADHISRTTLYTFQETMALSRRIQAKRVLFVHLEEYWNRSHDDYMALQSKYDNIKCAYDGMNLSV